VRLNLLRDPAFAAWSFRAIDERLERSLRSRVGIACAQESMRGVMTQIDST
jgi:hypothetical protein